MARCIRPQLERVNLIGQVTLLVQLINASVSDCPFDESHAIGKKAIHERLQLALVAQKGVAVADGKRRTHVPVKRGVHPLPALHRARRKMLCHCSATGEVFADLTGCVLAKVAAETPKA